MTIAILEIVYAFLEQQRQPPLPTPPSSKVKGIFAPKKSLDYGVIFWRPRGDRGATMEEGKLQIFFLILILLEK